jgi:hypothetical protein
MSFLPHDLTVTNAGNGMTPKGTVNAKGRASLIVPATPFESRWFIRVNPCWTDVDKVSREGTFQRAFLIPSEVGSVGNLHGSQVAITGKFLVETATSPAMDTPIHLVLDKDAQILVTVSPLFSKITSDAMATRYRHILEQTVATFVTDRAIMGMIHHEPLNDMLAKVDCFFIGR